MLLLSVSVRAFIGFGAAHACAADTLLTLGIPIAGCVGKATGGVISDRLGWIATSVGALLLSAPLIAFGGSDAHAILAGLLLLQMTMPVTLAAVAVVLPRRLATAFGLPCLALIIGALPTFFPAGKELYGDRLFFGLIIASAGVLFAALRLLGRHTR